MKRFQPVGRDEQPDASDTTSTQPDVSPTLTDLAGRTALLAGLLAESLGPDGGGPDRDGLVVDALRIARDAVPGARWASLTRAAAKPRTTGATDDVAIVLDVAQYRAGDGPCLSAIRTDCHIVSELTSEQRWPAFVDQIPDEVGVRSIVSCPLASAGHRDTSLNLYGDETLAASEVPSALLAASALALTLTAIEKSRSVENLTLALETNRTIGAAVGILMQQHHWTYEMAFDALRTASQHNQRKLRDLADEVLLTGALDL